MQKAGLKKVIASADQSEAAKTASARSHQRGTVRMARMIAAQEKRPVGKMLPSFHAQRTIAREKYPAKSFKDRSPERRWMQRSIRFGPNSHLPTCISDLDSRRRWLFAQEFCFDISVHGD